MRNQYKILAEKYEQVLEAGQEPVMTVNKNGAKEWRLNGKFHRLDGPAVEIFGSKVWFLNGLHHRIGGPAVEFINGNKEWWVNGKRHRLDGPAVEYAADGFKRWYLNGKLHRDDGPAVIYGTGDKEYWLDYKEYTKDKFNKEIQHRNILKKASDKTGIEMDI